MGTIADQLNTAMRDFVRYTGDGLPGEPVGRPLPVGDPASGQFNPPKKQVRDALLAIAGAADDVIESANNAADSADEAANSASESQAARVASILAASVSGPSAIKNTKAQATAIIGSLSEGNIVDVVNDESRNGGWSRYEVVAGALVFRRDMTSLSIVTPEMFGIVGAGANDNALFNAAEATGMPVYAFGPLYKLAGVLFDDVTRPTHIIFSLLTEVRNVQTSGTKVPAITVKGNKSATIYQINSFEKYTKTNPPTYGPTLTDISNSQALSLTVNLDVAPSDVAAGDRVEIYEDNGLTLETRFGTTSAEMSDQNYRQFLTVGSVSDTQVFFREFLVYPFKPTGSGNILRMRKINFKDSPVVLGGIYTGGVPAGGGVALELCHKGVVGDCKGRGNAVDDQLWGAPVYMKECWETERKPTYAENCLFAAHTVKNQECRFGTVGGKSTQNGGHVTTGDHMSHFAELVLSSPGIFSGDALSIGSGFRRNTVASLITAAGNCYGAWLRQSSDDNVILSVQSYNMITTIIQDFGNRNHWRVKSRGHPAGGVVVAGDDTVMDLDIECQGLAVQVRSGVKRPRIRGRAVSTGTDFTSFDLQLGAGIEDPIIDLTGGPRGVQKVSGYTAPIHSDIQLRGENPFSLRTFKDAEGSSGGRSISGVTATPQTLVIPGYTDGEPALVPLAVNAGDSARVYNIELHASVGLSGTQTAGSSYRVHTRQNTWYVQTLYEGTHPFAPRLTVDGVELKIALAGSSTQLVYQYIQRLA